MGQRRDFDAYQTADWQVAALADNLPELGEARTVLYPCAGDMSLCNALQAIHPHLQFVTNDIDSRKVTNHHFDATRIAMWHEMDRLYGKLHFDWVIENFPFSVEHQMIPFAYRFAKVGVVAMARISYCEPTKERGPWLSQHPYQKRITLERHSFTGDGHHDSTTTDWLVWSKAKVKGPFGVCAWGYRPTKEERR